MFCQKCNDERLATFFGMEHSPYAVAHTRKLLGLPKGGDISETQFVSALHSIYGDGEEQCRRTSAFVHKLWDLDGDGHVSRDVRTEVGV